MKHATSTTLAGLSSLLDQVRSKAGIKEKKLGIFYRKSRPFLHFHEDPAGIFADLNIGTELQRYAVNTPDEWNALLSSIDQLVQPEAARFENLTGLLTRLG